MVSMNLEKYDSCLVLVELQKLKFIYSDKYEEVCKLLLILQSNFK